MYRFKICNRIKLVCFLKFIIYEMNSKIVKSEMVVLSGREKADVDVAMSWMLQPVTRALVGEKKRES
jgi:hypothetical protein